MADENINGGNPKLQRMSFTTRLSLKAYDALIELQSQHRRKYRRHTPLWKLVDAAVTAYAEQNGIKSE